MFQFSHTSSDWPLASLCESFNETLKSYRHQFVNILTALMYEHFLFDSIVKDTIVWFAEKQL